jgi:hypothetical protein
VAWQWEAAMAKRYRVTLTAAEREALGGMISRGKADARKLTHARDHPTVFDAGRSGRPHHHLKRY